MRHEIEDYSAIAKLLHWLIAVFVIGLIGLGLFMTRAENLQLKFALYQLHKSMGITVLILMALRIAWRFIARPPRWPVQMPQWERRAAQSTHTLLYMLLLVIPLSGWSMVSAAQAPFNFPTVLYGIVPWPHIPAIENLDGEQKKTVETVLKNVHAALGWALLALVLLHIAAALRHSLILKDGVMLRMVPRFLRIGRLLLCLIMPATVFILSTSPGAAQGWAINNEKSRLTFEAEAGGQTVTGEFKQFRADIRFDPEVLDITEISAAIDTNSISTGQSEVDDALLSKDWFDAQTFPTAGFAATAIREGDEDGSYVLDGNLTIKGNRKPVTIPFTLEIDQGEGTVSGETTVNRRDFGLGPDGPISGLTIGDRVKIKLDLIATRLDN